MFGTPRSDLRPNDEFGSVRGSRRLLPSDIHSHLCSFHHPDHILADELRDGQEVVVDLVDQIEFDKNRTPTLSKWAFIAFNVSAEKQEERTSKSHILLHRNQTRASLVVFYSGAVVSHCS